MRFEEDVSDVDVVLDTIGGDLRKRSRRVLKKGGIVVSTRNAPSFVEADSLNVREAFVTVKSNAMQLKEIAKLVDSGVLHVQHKDTKNTKLRIM